MIRAEQFTKSAQEAALRAAGIMQRYGHHQIDTEHQLLALLEPPQGRVSQLLEFLHVDVKMLSAELDAALRAAPAGEDVVVGPGQIAITPGVARTNELAVEEAKRLGDELVSDEHLFLAMLREPDTTAGRLLEKAGLTYARVDEALRQMRG